MIKQVIDRPMFALLYPHCSCFMGGIWITGNYYFLHVTGTVVAALTSKQESTRMSLFSFHHFGACELLRSPQAVKICVRRLKLKMAWILPVSLCSRHSMLTKAEPMVWAMNQAGWTPLEHRSTSGRPELVCSLFSLGAGEVFITLRPNLFGAYSLP